MEIKKHGSGLAPDLLRNHRDDSGCLIVPESMPEATMGKAKCVSAQQFRLISRGVASNKCSEDELAGFPYYGCCVFFSGRKRGGS